MLKKTIPVILGILFTGSATYAETITCPSLANIDQVEESNGQVFTRHPVEPIIFGNFSKLTPGAEAQDVNFTCYYNGQSVTYTTTINGKACRFPAVSRKPGTSPGEETCTGDINTCAVTCK